MLGLDLDPIKNAQVSLAIFGDLCPCIVEQDVVVQYTSTAKLQVLLTYFHHGLQTVKQSSYSHMDGRQTIFSHVLSDEEQWFKYRCLMKHTWAHTDW